jgi:hypothetical protein
MTIGCRWCDIIILNVHALTEEKSDDVKGRFYEELEQVFDKFPNYHMKILVGTFNAKVGRDDIFKPTIGNERITVIQMVKLLTYQGKCKFLHPYVLHLEYEVRLSLKSYISLNC